MGKTMLSFFKHKAVRESGSRERGLSPLHQVAEGREVRIRELSATPEVTCRLREIGLCEGQIIRLIARHSNIICQVCNARLALNAQLAGMILVEALAE
jgi:Fe2+ transport system protein FeoA